jgi:cytochrome c
MRLQKTVILAVLIGGFAGSALAQEEGDAEAGERVFNKCKACHQVGADAKNRVGPVLTGVVGREAAAVEDFKYSDAMLEKKTEGLVWTEEHLSEYLENPKGYIPGNKMSFAGLKKPEERADVIAYLMSVE